MLMMARKKKNVIIFLLVIFSFCLGSVKLIEEDVKSEEQVCNSNTKQFDLFSIVSVGLLSATVFALVGVLPSVFIRSDADEARFVNSLLFKCLLAFAAGSLLAEVFLHLLPESMENASNDQVVRNGLNSIGSFFIFLTIEKFTELIPNAHALGTLNLVANFVDNSAHGTTVVGAFQTSIKFGLVALLATIIHEIPHEFSDFALLLRDGYSRKAAIFAQLLTSLAGTIGATIAYAMTAKEESQQFCMTAALNTAGDQMSNASALSHHPPNHRHGSLILPFTIGGFLYIALVGIIPEIIEEKNQRTSFLQIVSFLVGVLFIYSLTQIEALLPLLFL